MRYEKKVKLKDGRECLLRSGERGDARAVIDVYNLTHEQTDNLLAYPDECTMTEEREGDFLQREAESGREVMILAIIDGRVIGMAGIESKGEKYKIAHRADFGIGIDRAYWGLGVGRALLDACVECAKEAGYRQIELGVLAKNERAISLYGKAGFKEFGRNPRGFQTRGSGYEEMILMRLELT